MLYAIFFIWFFVKSYRLTKLYYIFHYTVLFEFIPHLRKFGAHLIHDLTERVIMDDDLRCLKVNSRHQSDLRWTESDIIVDSDISSEYELVEKEILMWKVSELQ